MSDIPLNIDTPSGVPFTVNKSVRVDSTGRIFTRLQNCNPSVKICNGKVVFTYLNAAHDASLEVSVREARLLAFEILKLTEPQP